MHEMLFWQAIQTTIALEVAIHHAFLHICKKKQTGTAALQMTDQGMP